jgi:hypothetical protein
VFYSFSLPIFTGSVGMGWNGMGMVDTVGVSDRVSPCESACEYVLNVV